MHSLFDSRTLLRYLQIQYNTILARTLSLLVPCLSLTHAYSYRMTQIRDLYSEFLTLEDTPTLA